MPLPKALRPVARDWKFTANIAKGTRPIIIKNGIDGKASAKAGPANASAKTPINVPLPKALRPFASDVKFVDSAAKGVIPINNKNGIDGKATTKAGPANASAKIPLNVPLPIALNPAARSCIFFLIPPLLSPSPTSSLVPKTSLTLSFPASMASPFTSSAASVAASWTGP